MHPPPSPVGCAGFAYIFFHFKAKKNPLFFAYFRFKRISAAHPRCDGFAFIFFHFKVKKNPLFLLCFTTMSGAPYSLARADFSIMMECMPESSNCRSVCSLYARIPSRICTVQCPMF
jgi:hypothetical protein